jgi:hypothetical protein
MANNEGGTITHPKAIECFRLASLIAQLKLEKVGMTSRGGALRPRICKEFGLSRVAKHDVYIEVIKQKKDELTQELIKEGVIEAQS